MNNDSLVSVVITTRNEENNIKNCLKSIKSQTYFQEKIEIIVVDNNSIDKTEEIAKEYTERVFNRGPERAAQRNFGVERANGKYILYLDADMILSKDVISECVIRCENEGYIALYIPERIIGKGFWIKVRDFERSFYNATVIDCVRFVRRDKFLEIGGFDENLTGPEDWDFDRRIRETGKVDIINVPLYHNEGQFNLRTYINKKAYYAKSFDKYVQKWSHIDSSAPVDSFPSTGQASNGIKARTDPIIKKQLGLWYRLFGVFLENGKWKKLLRHPMLTLGMYFLKVMMGIQYLIGR